MKTIIAVNASPRTGWNTAQLVRSAADGAASAGAEVKYVNLYQLEKFTGCISCFGCKRGERQGVCVCRDGLTETLEAIRNADGLIVGSPIYFGNLTAGFRAFYERVLYQYVTYCPEAACNNPRRIPVLLIADSGCPEAGYAAVGYDKMLEDYRRSIDSILGPTRLLVSSDTLQVTDYGKYHWTMFDPAAKQQRHDTVFPEDLKKAFAAGAELSV